MKRVGFILKREMREAHQLVSELAPWVLERGGTPMVSVEDNVELDTVEVLGEEELGQACDLAVVLGGDGTILRAGHLVADRGVPVLGINLGRLGFLTPFVTDEAAQALADAAAGNLPVVERSRLLVTLIKADVDEPLERAALNDAVIHQGEMARLIELEAFIDDHLITSYRADGLIVATPTGSTAYNLAAGGPIIMPGQESMTLTPICAHALTHRPLVVPKESRITVRLGGDPRAVVLTVDGQWARPFAPGDEVRITNAQEPLRLFGSAKGYFDILRDKLHWGRTPV